RDRRHRFELSHVGLQKHVGAAREPPLLLTTDLFDYRLPTTDCAYAAALVLFLAKTSPNTFTAFCISSIVPSVMRACVFSNGGKSRATSTPLARHAVRNSAADDPMLTNMKFAWQSVG